MSTPDPKKLERSPTTCIVGCRLPHGLVLELRERVRQDGKETFRTVESHTIKGMNDTRIVGGYGLTDGIPTEFMERWLGQNEKHPAVLNGSIFMHTDQKSVLTMAKERRSVRSGIEPIDPLDQGTQSRFKIHMDKDGERAYRKQLAENPVRDRQIVE